MVKELYFKGEVVPAYLELDVKEAYLDYFNNFLTRTRFCEHYGISINSFDLLYDAMVVGDEKVVIPYVLY